MSESEFESDQYIDNDYESDYDYEEYNQINNVLIDIGKKYHTIKHRVQQSRQNIEEKRKREELATKLLTESIILNCKLHKVPNLTLRVNLVPFREFGCKNSRDTSIITRDDRPCMCKKPHLHKKEKHNIPIDNTDCVDCIPSMRRVEKWNHLFKSKKKKPSSKKKRMRKEPQRRKSRTTGSKTTDTQNPKNSANTMR